VFILKKIYNLHKQKTGGAAGAASGEDFGERSNAISEEARIIEITEQNIAVDDLLD
jgi:hypothetical protein